MANKSKKIKLTKNIKILITCIACAVVVVGVTLGIVFGVKKDKDIFDYIKMEVNTQTDTYTVIGVSDKLKGKLELPEEYKGRKITLIGNNAFDGCSLEEIILPNTITNFGKRAFANCTELKKINIPETLYTLGEECFLNCESLESFTANERMTTISESAFRNCKSLKTVTLNDKLIRIGFGAFGHCKALTKIEIPASVRSINGSLFSYSTGLTEVVVDSDNEYFESNGKNCIVEKETGKLISGCNTSVIPDGVKIIGASAFEGMTNFDTASIPSSVEQILDCAFYSCEKLGTLNSGFIDIGACTYIGRMAFAHCKGLTRIEIAGLIEEMGSSVFSNCVNVERVDISAMSFKKIEFFTFSSCVKLETVNITNNLEEIGSNAFSRCSSLTSVTLPNSIEVINNNAFEKCISLREIYIPSNIEILGPTIFSGCDSSLVIKIGCVAKKDGFSDRFNHYAEGKELVVQYNAQIII